MFIILTPGNVFDEVHSSKEAARHWQARKKSTNKYSKVKLKPICLLSNRSKSVNKYYNISRIKQRDMLSFGIFPGYKKAVW